MIRICLISVSFCHKVRMTSNLTFEESLQVLEKCLKLTFSLPYSSTSSSHHHSHHSASHTMSQQPPSLDLTSSRDFASSVASDFNSALLQLETYFLRCRMLASIEGECIKHICRLFNVFLPFWGWRRLIFRIQLPTITNTP